MVENMDNIQCIFLDDEREFYDAYWVKYPKHLTDENVYVVRNFFDFTKVLKKQLHSLNEESLSKLILSFDHDLGDYYLNKSFLKFVDFINKSKVLMNNYQEKDFVTMFFEHYFYTQLTENDFIDFLQQGFLPVLAEIKNSYSETLEVQQEINEVVELAKMFSENNILKNMLDNLKEKNNLLFEDFFEVISFAEMFDKYKKGNELTGYSCLQYFLDSLLDMSNQLNLVDCFNIENYFVHSQNNVKKEQMLGLISNFNDFIQNQKKLENKTKRKIY